MNKSDVFMDKLLGELAEWANRHGVSFKATGDLISSCPTINEMLDEIQRYKDKASFDNAWDGY